MATEAETPSVVELVNVSEGGLGIVGVRALRVGDIHYFRMTRWNEAPLKGVVCWVDSAEGRAYAGIQFVDLSETQRRALKELVRKFDAEDWGGAASAPGGGTGK